MKIFFLLLSFVLLAGLSNAKVWTVSNDPNTPAQFSDVPPAITAAAAGDTIYISGSNSAYSSCFLHKSLTLIGAGYNPIPSTLSTQIPYISLSTGASGSTIIGLTLSGDVGFSIFDSTGVSNITISRNYLYGFIELNPSSYNYLIINNIFITNPNLGILLQNTNKIFISNNIFLNTNTTSIEGYQNYKNTILDTVLITNNIFMGLLGHNSVSCISNLNYLVISNNIFWAVMPQDTNIGFQVNYSAYNNNITYQTGLDSIPYGTNIGSGNIIATNPQFINAPYNGTNSVNLTYNYGLQPGSPGHNAVGTDGTDIGIYGGKYPFIDLTGRASIPYVKQLKLTNSTIGVGTKLNVQVTGEKHN